ncbi:hypothetical protein [Sphingomonas sp. dw_22]|uniref:hypothetical protein n=1 Tax=Sphingomonas sp. dw_22 TaxID=2721175 RepID=UPI001BD22607|nr:hypothetical protein [Sphingomonas sp. dw_22]
MVDEPGRGLLAEDNEESDEFLCGVAAECVNDALLVLEHFDTDAKAYLQRALSVLVERGTVESASLKSSQSLKPKISSKLKAKLSPAAKEIVENYIACASSRNFATSPRGLIGAKHALRQTGISPGRQRAILLLMEALSVLDEERDREMFSHIQIAMDRARSSMDTPPAASPDSSERDFH